MLDSFAEITLWVVYGTYCFGLLPQIFLNYKLRSTSGMSDFMLFGYFAGYVAQLYYVMGGDFPLALRIMVPMSICMVSIMVFQRFYYNTQTVTPFMKRAYGGTIAFALLFVPIFIKINPPAGILFGWVSTSIWFVYQLPQITKIYREKAFNGISFAFLSIMTSAVFLEFVSSLILELPIPTIFSNVRAMIIYAIFIIQFRLYRSSGSA